ncbi:MAG TPA: restriction endonuclease [Dehalococcoidales bacterium]|nr:restriction endonuclease [Dehalococcoidales bacterium]
MAIPDYQTLMLPLLRLAGDNREHSIREAIDRLSNEFKLTDDEKKELLPSGKQEIFDNRVGWARTYLKKAGLIEITRWGYFRITERGIELLKKNVPKIDVRLLYRYPEFREFKSYKLESKEMGEVEKGEGGGTPKEELENAYQKITNELAKDLLQELKTVSPTQFEHIVIDLLVKMGYGGSYKDAAKAIGGVGDGGVDGVISEDRLGLSTIYVQAKRWQNKNVGHPEIRDFSGALDLKHAEKGVFITTSGFNKDACEGAGRSSKRIILIDGSQLAKLMIEYNVGVTSEDTLKVQRIDKDYFIEE